MKYPHMNIPQVVSDMFPAAKVRFNGRSYKDIEWLENSKKPTLEELEDFFELQERKKGILDHRISVISNLNVMTEDQIKSEANKLAQPEIDRIVSESEKRLADMKQAIIDSLFEDSLKREEESAEHMWLEIKKGEEKKRDEAIKYLLETQHQVVYCKDCGKEKNDFASEEVLQKREEARNIVLRAKMVFLNYDTLRAREYPSKQERIDALREGGIALLKLRKKIQEVNEKYHRPSRGKYE